LEQAVLEYVATYPDYFPDLADGQLVNPAQSVLDLRPFTELVEPPPDKRELGPRVWTPSARIVSVDFVRRDAENRRLGTLGEEFIFELERRRLHDEARRPDLAKKVEWTARERGDGAGYDIASFNGDGSQRYIEVKTTGLGKSFPFYVSANEVRCFEALGSAFQLCRVFRFWKGPGLFILPGALSQTCALDAVQYQARFE
jgi:hypothetical protein